MEEPLTALRLVCGSHPLVAALPHATHTIDAFLLGDASQWSLESASQRGFVRLLDRLRRLEWPGFTHSCRQERLRCAITKGYDVSVLQWWLDCYLPGQTVCSRSFVCRLAIKNKQLHVVQWLVQETKDQIQPDSFQGCESPEIAYWLHAQDRELPVAVSVGPSASAEFIQWCMTVKDDPDCAFKIVWPSTMDVIRMGHIEILQRLSNFQPKRKYLNIALRHGHIAMAKWLHGNFPKPFSPELGCSKCYSSAGRWCALCQWKRMDLETARWVFSELEWKGQSVKLRCMKNVALIAAVQGDLDVIKFIFELSTSQRRSVSASQSDLDPECFEKAAAKGHLAVVLWLHEQNQPYSRKTMAVAAKNGHLEIVQWLHLHRSEGFSTHAMDAAARNGHLEIVRWLHENRTEGCSTYAMDDAAMNGHLHVVKWLHQNRTEGCTRQAMNLAAREGHLEVIKWLHANRDEGCTARAMNNAAANGHLEVVRWLHENRSEGCTPQAMDRAAFGEMDMLQFLHENRTEGCTSLAQVHAVTNGRLDIFKWLHEHRPERCSPATFLSSILNTSGHYDIIAFAARHPGYISLHMAVDILLKRKQFETAESILREASAEELVLLSSELLDTSSSWHSGMPCRLYARSAMDDGFTS